MVAKFTTLIVLLLVVGRVTPQILGPVQGNTAANIINYVNENYGQDGYKFMYATDDQTVREEMGEFVNGIWTVTGFVKWLSPDKKTEHTVKYKADDKGYHAVQEFRILPGVPSGPPGPIRPEPPRPTTYPLPAGPQAPEPAPAICSGTLASLCG